MNEEAEVQRGLREFDKKKHKQMRRCLLWGLALAVLCIVSCVTLLPRSVEVIKISVQYDPIIVSDAASAAALCEGVKEEVAKVNDYYRRSGIRTRYEVVCAPFEDDAFYIQALATTRLLTGAAFEGE